LVRYWNWKSDGWKFNGCELKVLERVVRESEGDRDRGKKGEGRIGGEDQLRDVGQ